MHLEQQLKAVTDSLEDAKAEAIVTLKILEQSADIEAIVIASARSNQHARGVANRIKIEVKRLGMKVLGIEGTSTAEWILIDLAEVVVHIMTEQTRDFYKLEKLWSGSRDEN